MIAFVTSPKFTIRGFRPPREAARSSLGTLEAKVMDAAWGLDRFSVREMVAALGDSLAYTTVMTTLDRLYKKGLLERDSSGRAFVYSAKISRSELQTGIAGDVISGLIDGAAKRIEPVLACIVDAVSEKDLLLLDELERLVKEKKAALRERSAG